MKDLDKKGGGFLLAVIEMDVPACAKSKIPLLQPAHLAVYAHPDGAFLDINQLDLLMPVSQKMDIACHKGLEAEIGPVLPVLVKGSHAVAPLPGFMLTR
jgi:hypothetical protein